MDMHDGEGQIITYIEYKTGVRSGEHPYPAYPHNIRGPLITEKDRLRKAQETGIVLRFSELQKHNWGKKAEAIVEQVFDSYPEGMIKIYGNDYARNRHGSKHDYYAVGSNNRKIVGFKGGVCDSCLAIYALEMYQGRGNYKVYLGRHSCQLGDVSGRFPIVENNSDIKQTTKNRLSYQELQMLMICVVKGIEKKMNAKCYLFAGSIPHQVPLLNENYIDISISSNNMTGNDGWLHDLLLYGKIQEPQPGILGDFFSISQMQTYSGFRVYGANPEPTYYYMGVGFE
jgi:hypothetical protein